MNIRSACGMPLAIVSALCFFFGTCFAQQPDVNLTFSYDPTNKEDKDRTSFVDLRPNVLSHVYLFAEADENDKGKVFKLLVRDGDKKVVFSKDIAIAGKNFQVSLPIPGNEPKKSGTLSIRPPIHITTAADREFKKGIKILAPKPNAYIGADGEYDPKKETLQITLTALNAVKTKKFKGKALAELVIDPDRLPQLLTEDDKEPRKSGKYVGKLELEPNANLKLRAENLKFKGKAVDGLIYLNVDGYPRGIILRALSSDIGTDLVTFNPLKKEDQVIHFQHPRFVQPGKPLKVTVEVDNSLENSKFAVGAYQDLELEEKEFKKFKTDDKRLNWIKNRLDSELREFRGDRKEAVVVQNAPGGGLLLKRTTPTDWTFELPTDGIHGNRKVVVQSFDVSDNDNKKISTFRSIARIAKESVGLQDKIKRLSGDILFKEGGPEIIDIRANLPTQIDDKETHLLNIGEPIKLTAKAIDEVEIKKVVFFEGFPTSDGKAPKNAVETFALSPVSGEKDTWEAVMLLQTPTNIGRTFPVSVQFTNALGASSIKTIKIQLIDPKAVAAKDGKDPGEPKPKSATIKGTVSEGALGVKDVPVTLADEKGKKLAAAVTGKGGAFTFENVPPGVYTISAARAATRTNGSAVVGVPKFAGKVPDVKISLTR